jgi:hypothetical protein
MLSYDMLGHAFAALARFLAENGSARAAFLWNSYSTCIWPRIPNQLHYDVHWAVWHGITIALYSYALLQTRVTTLTHRRPARPHPQAGQGSGETINEEAERPESEVK